MKKTMFGALVALVVAATLAGAQVHLGVMGGWVLPNGTTGDYAKSGYGGGLTMQIGAPAVPVTFRIDGTYGQMNGKPMTVTTPGGTETFKSDFTVWSGTANAVVTVFGRTLPTKIYLIGGIGYYSIEQKVTASPITGPPVPTASSFGYNIGLGVRFTKLFIEARWNHVSDGLMQNDLTKTALEFVPVNVGLIF